MLFSYLLSACFPLIALIAFFVFAYKTAPMHPLPNPRSGDKVGIVDYVLGNWKPDSAKSHNTRRNNA